MATHKSSEKRNRQNKKRRMRNMSIKSHAKTRVKSVLKAVDSKNPEEARKALLVAVTTLQKASCKKVMHKNTASRKISRLTRKVNALAKTA